MNVFPPLFIETVSSIKADALFKYVNVLNKIHSEAAL